jgi:hypothetical protein
MDTEWLLREMKRSGYCKGAQFVTALGYYWLLCLADRTILAPAFGYQGLMYRSATIWMQIGVVGLIMLCVAVTPVRPRQPSDGVLYVLLPLVVIPVVTVAATDVLFANVARSLIISVAGAYLLLAACSRLPRAVNVPSRPPPQRLTRRQPWALALAIVLSGVSYGLMFATFGVHLRLLSFSDVYGVRVVFAEQAPGALGYLLDWQGSVINPLFIVYGIWLHRSLPIVAGLFGDFLIYSTTGYKSVLFSLLVITAFLLVMRRKDIATRRPAAGAFIGFAFAVLVAVSIAIDKVSNTILWTSLFVRRLSLVAGVNTGYYFQYFSTNPRTHLAYGVVGKVLGVTGAVPPPQQIALYAYNSTIGDPNANIWADAYANFGHTGIVVFTLILAAFLWFYDWAARNVDLRVATVLLVASALTLANSALLTCLLTHGMLLTLLVISRWPPNASQVQEPVDPPAVLATSASSG